MTYTDNAETNILVGRVITAVYLATDNKALQFVTTYGEAIIARCDADCCSSTWIEHVEGAENLLNTTVLTVEDINMPTYDMPERECMAFYGCKITTARGECVIDYRNESNGYYGGSLEWPDAAGHNADFYSGAFGQNVSTEQWRKIAG